MLRQLPRMLHGSLSSNHTRGRLAGCNPKGVQGRIRARLAWECNERWWANIFSESRGATAAAVQERFLRHGLLRPNVRILPGWLNDTLSDRCRPIHRLALLRIDVDVYAATYDALTLLYPSISPGGYVLLDDWRFDYAKQAVLDYRQLHSVSSPIEFLPGTVDTQAYWRK